MTRFKSFKTLRKPGFNELIPIRLICMESKQLILRDTVTEDLELIIRDCLTAQKKALKQNCFSMMVLAR